MTRYLQSASVGDWVYVVPIGQSHLEAGLTGIIEMTYTTDTMQAIKMRFMPHRYSMKLATEWFYYDSKRDLCVGKHDGQQYFLASIEVVNAFKRIMAKLNELGDELDDE